MADGILLTGLGHGFRRTPWDRDLSALLPIDHSLRSSFRAAVVLLCALVSFTCGSKAAPAWSQAGPAFSNPVTSHFAIADFDGDSQPDLATVQTGRIGPANTRYWIRFQFSTGSRLAIGVTAPAGGLQIATRDVNGDNALDLIVTTAWLNRPVAVLVNDGHGGFTLSDPATFPGIVWGSQAYFTPTGVQWRDATVDIPSRYSPGAACKSKSVAARRSLPGFFVPLAAGRPVFLSAASVFGRAPPAFLPHV